MRILKLEAFSFSPFHLQTEFAFSCQVLPSNINLCSAGGVPVKCACTGYPHTEHTQNGDRQTSHPLNAWPLAKAREVGPLNSGDWPGSTTMLQGYWPVPIDIKCQDSAVNSFCMFAFVACGSTATGLAMKVSPDQ
jgi:hypothetical protein